MIWYSQINYLFLNYKNYLVDKLQKALIFLYLVEHNECQASRIKYKGMLAGQQRLLRQGIPYFYQDSLYTVVLLIFRLTPKPCPAP